MNGNSIEFLLFLIFTGAALLATAALFARQAMIVAYIVLGLVLGPYGLDMVGEAQFVQQVSNVGIMFLLYLLGLDLLPQQLGAMLGEALSITFASCAIFWIAGFAIGWGFGLPLPDAALVGAALMFSSTIIGVKLMPTTALHHRHTGQMLVSILLLQDLLAIAVLLLLQGFGRGETLLLDIVRQLATLPVLVGVAWLLERLVIVKLITRFDRIHEYIFLLAIAWCLGIAECAKALGLSHEIGAFIAGITLASSPIALFITDRLKPLRDFFLILFFFSIGATFNVGALDRILLPALALAVVAIGLKPLIFRQLFVLAGEKKYVSLEVGFRLGQISEFSLLIAMLAVESGFSTGTTSYLIQLAALITFIVSSYIIVMRYPTPIAISDRLRRD